MVMQMITKYQVRTMENNEEVLILWISLEEEFSNEWFTKMKEVTFKEFIDKHNIVWNGTKVFLVVGGIVLTVLNYPSVSSNNYNYIPDNLNTSVVINEVVDTLEKEEVVEEDVKEEVKQEVVEENKSEVKQEEVKKPSTSTNSNKGNIDSNVAPTIPTVTPSEDKKDEVVIPPIDDSSQDSKDEVNNQQPEQIVETVTVYRANGQVVSLSITDYLTGVVAAEMPASFNIEALKAQSILARTYLRKSQSVGKKLTDTVDTQRYIDKSEMRKLWGNSFDTYYSKIENAVKATSDLVVVYHNNLIDAVYHSTSNGKTEDSSYVWGNSFPYLQPVSSTWDIITSSYFRSIEIDKSKFLNTFGITDNSYYLEILSRNSSGRVEFIKIGDKVYTGAEVRSKLGLRSTDFDIYLKDNTVQIDTRGYGHGVGLSQYGSNGMAKEGYNYLEIIKHYYSGVDIISLI